MTEPLDLAPIKARADQLWRDLFNCIAEIERQREVFRRFEATLKELDIHV